MIFEAADGQSLELRILGYQYPDLETEDYDSNWLNVEGKVAHPRGDFKDVPRSLPAHLRGGAAR